jgi:hypothetical protein
MRRLSVISVVTTFIVATMAFAAPAAAQTAPPAPAAPPQLEQGQQTPPPAAPQVTPPQAPQPPYQQPPSPSRPIDPAQLVNVRVELTITESHGTNSPLKKTVLVITRSDSRGSVRSSMGGPGYTMGVNVDARPHIEKDGRIDLNLTFQYTPEGTAEGTRPADLNETMEVFLTDGRAMLISQSADPKGDRKVTVEVTATIVK